MTDTEPKVTAAAINALLHEWCHLPYGAPNYHEKLVALGDRLHGMLQALAKEVGRL
jgi:hypothetical protein